jgi:hypothetical protein
LSADGTYLLVGGSRDGERMPVAGRPKELRAPARWAWGDPSSAVRAPADVYRLVELQDGVGVHYAYMHIDFSNGDVMKQLLDGYRENKHRKDAR